MNENSLILATHNTGKIAEFKRYLEPLGLQLTTAKEHGVQEPVEDADSFVGNALIKARAIFQQTKCAALADDSGLCVNALDGAPGVYSAFYGGEDRDFQKAMRRVLDELKDADDRSAYFISVLVYIDKSGREHIAEGRINGVITKDIQGAEGFGYDPIFIPEGADKSFGEMTKDEKKLYSHRARALQKLLEILKV